MMPKTGTSSNAVRPDGYSPAVLSARLTCWSCAGSVETLFYPSRPCTSGVVPSPFALNTSSHLGILRPEIRQTWPAWTAAHPTCHTCPFSELTSTCPPTRPSHEGRPPLTVSATYDPPRADNPSSDRLASTFASPPRAERAQAS